MGSIFLEQLSSPDLTDKNTIVYGHNMNDGSMFASLRDYREQDYFEDHPYVYILTDLGVYRYELFSSYTASIKSNTYGVEFPTETSWLRFLEKGLEDSVIDTGIQPEPTDRVLTLSTCTGANRSARWVVHARLKMVLE
jgi:sortase B